MILRCFLLGAVVVAVIGVEFKEFAAFQPKFEGDWIDTGELFDVNEVLRNMEVPVTDTATQPAEASKPQQQDNKTRMPVCPVCPKPTVQEVEHCKMFDLMLLKIARSGFSLDKSEVSVNLRLSFTPSEFERLTKYAENSCGDSDAVTRALLRVLSTVEVNPKRDINDVFIGFIERVMMSITSLQPYLIIIAVTITIVSFILWMWYFSRSYYHAILRMGLIFFVLSCCWNWVRMYQHKLAEKEAQLTKYKSEMPAACRPHNLGIMESISIWLKGTFTFNSDECVEFHKFFIVDPIWEVSPLLAAQDTITRIVFHPFSLLGEYIGLFVRNLFMNLPVQLWLPVTVGVCFFFFLYMVMHHKYRIRLPFFLAALEPAVVNPERLNGCPACGLQPQPGNIAIMADVVNPAPIAQQENVPPIYPIVQQENIPPIHPVSDPVPAPNEVQPNDNVRPPNLSLPISLLNASQLAEPSAGVESPKNERSLYSDNPVTLLNEKPTIGELETPSLETGFYFVNSLTEDSNSATENSNPCMDNRNPERTYENELIFEDEDLWPNCRPAGSVSPNCNLGLESATAGGDCNSTMAQVLKLE